MRWGKCKRCGKGARCVCMAMGRHEEKSKPAGRVQKHNQGNQWCNACGCLVRSGKCVSSTCGKKA